MANTNLSPDPVLHGLIQLEEVNKRLENMLEANKQHSYETICPHYLSNPHQGSLYDGHSPALSSDNQFTNSTSSSTLVPGSPGSTGEQAPDQEISPSNYFQGNFVPDQQVVYSMESTTYHQTPEYGAEQGTNESQSSFPDDIIQGENDITYPMESDNIDPETSESFEKESDHDVLVSPNCFPVNINHNHPDVIHPPDSTYYIPPANPSSFAPPVEDHTFGMFSQHSHTSTYPEFVVDEAANEEIMSSNCYQGHFDPAQDAVPYQPAESDDYIRLEHLGLLDPSYHLLDTLPQSPPTPQYSQNVYEGYKGSNELGGGLDYNQGNAGMDNYTPTPALQASITNTQNLPPQEQFQVPELKQLLDFLPAINQLTDPKSYIVSSTLTTKKTVKYPSGKKETTTNTFTTNYQRAGRNESHHPMKLATPGGANVQYRTLPHSPSHSHYSALGTMLGYGYEQQAWSQ